MFLKCEDLAERLISVNMLQSLSSFVACLVVGCTCLPLPVTCYVCLEQELEGVSFA